MFELAKGIVIVIAIVIFLAQVAGCSSAIMHSMGLANTQQVVAGYPEVRLFLRERLHGADPFTLSKADAAIDYFDKLKTELDELSVGSLVMAIPQARIRARLARHAFLDLRGVVMQEKQRFSEYELITLDDYAARAERSYEWVEGFLANLDASDAVNVDVRALGALLDIGDAARDFVLDVAR